MITRLARIAAGRLSQTQKSRIHALLDPILLPVSSIQSGKRPTAFVALTFDDGPDVSVTPRILDALSAARCRATFFVLVEAAVEHPELVRRIVAEGHEVGLHSDRHDRLTTLSPWTVFRRLRKARADLEALTGGTVRRFRPPFGSQSLLSYLAARAAGLEVVVWNVTPQDWLEQTAGEAAGRLLCAVRGGDIALLHDGLAVPSGELVPTFDRAEMVRLIVEGLRLKQLEPASVQGLIDAAGAKKSAWFRV